MNFIVPQIEHIQGIKTVPGDKSISHRALMIAAISKGTTEITNCSKAIDPLSTLSCIKQLGIKVEEGEEKTLVFGKGRYGFERSDLPLDAGNSGTTMRLLSGLLVGQKFSSMITGDSSLNKRPMKRIIEPLRLMGANIRGTNQDTAPLVIEPCEKLKAISYQLPIPTAQVKSCIIFAGLYADGTTKIFEKVKTRDHTERMLGLKSYSQNNMNVIEVEKNILLDGKRFFVPGDISSAAFLIASALLLKRSTIVIKDVGLNPTRNRVIDIFRRMGGNIIIENEKVIEGEPIGDIKVAYSELKSNIELDGEDVAELIDEIPILAVTSMFAEGTFSVRKATELRAKETDRISAIVNNIRLLGGNIEEYQDGFILEGKKEYFPNLLKTYGDHRIAMAFGVAGFCIKGIELDDAECVNISFPNFWQLVSMK